MTDGAGDAAFRARVRAFIAASAPDLPYRTGTRSPASAEESAAIRRWCADLFTAEIYGRDWPVEFGGSPDANPTDAFIVTEELARARAVVPLGSAGVAAHALIHFGTDEQRRRFLPRIRAGEHVWCQLFSEPDAGSDLASLRTTAVRDGSHFVINGQKVWSTDSAFADMGYLLARTDTTAPKHRGISAFALDMRLPGITLRPLREMTGTADFSEVFFDNVIVEADALIGAENDGWRIATESLASERGAVGAMVLQLRQNLDALIATAPTYDPVVRQHLASLHSRVEVASLVAQAALRRRTEGQERASDMPLGKLGFARLNWDIAAYGLTMQGASGMLGTDDAHAAEHGRWQDELLYAKAYTISGGTNQIMRNMLAERGLGLPREPA